MTDCYQRHQQGVTEYFANRQQDLLTINVCNSDSFGKLLSFVNASSSSDGFSKMNIGGKITAWKQIKHPLKIASTNAGKIDPV